MWVPIEHPSDELVEALWKETRSRAGPCPDCGTVIGNEHDENCDVAHCLVCHGQRIGCDCKDGGGEIWTGIWPNTEVAYKHKLVCQWKDRDGTLSEPSFDLNSAAMVKIPK